SKDGLDKLHWGITGQRQSSVQYAKVSFPRWVNTGALLVGREEQLHRLDQAWTDRRTNLVSIVGWGGVGKSALLNSWLGAMATGRFKGAERVFGWSFYSLGGSDEKAASVEEFVNGALAATVLDSPTAVSLWDRMDQLLNTVRQQRILMVLD